MANLKLTFKLKKDQLIGKIKNGSAVIVYSANENICDVITTDEFKKYQKQLIEPSESNYK